MSPGGVCIARLLQLLRRPAHAQASISGRHMRARKRKKKKLGDDDPSRPRFRSRPACRDRACTGWPTTSRAMRAEGKKKKKEKRKTADTGRTYHRVGRYQRRGLQILETNDIYVSGVDPPHFPFALHSLRS